MTKKKSVDVNASESSPPLTQQQQQQIVQPPPSLPSIPTDNSEHLLNETSLDSVESTSPIAITPPPAKPPRNSEESASSSSTEINSPPAKPPRHFSLYSNENEEGLIQQTDTVVKKVLNIVDTFGTISENDNDMTILRQSPPPIYVQQPSTATEFERENSDTVQTPDVSPIEPEQTSSSYTDLPATAEALDESITLTTTAPFPTSLPDFSDPSLDESRDIQTNDESPSYEINQLATNLTENIFHEIEKELERQEKLIKIDDREDRFEQPSTTQAFPLDAPPLIKSFVTTQPSSSQSTSRPLMFVSHDPTFNVSKPFSPTLNIVTTKSTPKITTSVTVISPPEPEISSTTTATMNLISDDEEQLNSSSTLVPNSSIASDRSKFLQSSSKDSSIDSNDTIPSDNTSHHQQPNTGSATPARSLISDYDNLHGSYGSLNDDNQQNPPPPPPSSASSETIPSISTTATSSMSTIYESMDTIPSSSTPTFVTAMSTLTNNSTSGSETAIQRLNSDISDEDLVESHEVETPILTSVNPFRTSKGRIASHHIASSCLQRLNKHEIILSF